MTTNLFDYFETLPGHDGAEPPWAARAPRRPQPDYDLMLLPRVKNWQTNDDALAALDTVATQDWAGEILRHGDEVRVRLDDTWIEMTGAALEAGGDSEVRLSDLARNSHYSVQFWDANATKALHVGHLRNLAIGNALAAALSQAGARVERRSLISDAGRSMGEAMAGVCRSGQHAQSWPDADQKSDHFVGVCYADYVARNGLTSNRELGAQEDSLTRELEVEGDAADQLLKRVFGGDRDALQLWFKTRAWVIAGQRKTLARLGVAFDRVFFESDFLAEATRITAQGLGDGRLHQREDGVVTYATGMADLSELPLVRADGLPTQHLRAVAYWMSAPELESVTTLQVCGTEWVSHAACIRHLMTELKSNGNGHVHPTKDIFHGMVAHQKRPVASSSENVLLIDDLIEWLQQTIDASPSMTAVRRAHPAPERIPAQIILGYFLPYAITPSVEFLPDRLLRDHRSLGWDLVRAQAHYAEAPSDGTRPAREQDYRFAVVQSELYRRYLRLAVDRLDIRPIAHYLKHLALWYPERGRSHHVALVVRTLLERAARGLGLEGGR